LRDYASNRIIEINYKLNKYKRKVQERLTSEQGIYHSSKRYIKPKAVSGQSKHNSQFNTDLDKEAYKRRHDKKGGTPFEAPPFSFIFLTLQGFLV
jgi:hypothetical protein